MPVPVPRYSKQPSHPVVKQVASGDSQPNQFQSLTRTLPVSPTGPPPSFGTREQWINSLPTWRRTKPRRIWEQDTRTADRRPGQDFYRGLIGAGNASVIKGAHAEASIPPLYNLFATVQLPEEMALRPSLDPDADDEMGSDNSTVDRSQLAAHRQWSASSPTSVDDDDMTKGSEGNSVASGVASFEEESYAPDASTPVFEDDHSPGAASVPDRDSSPLQPITPFGLFVDRAVASQPYAATFSKDIATHDYAQQDKFCGPQCYAAEPAYQPAAVPQEPAPALEVVTPCATTGYKKLAEPLADWIAQYVWKVCTTGLSLPSMFAHPSSQAVVSYPNLPPSHLATSVHSLLLSTLLQPSVVFLGIWYIVRLPVYLNAAPLGPEHFKEARFRAALLGDSYTGLDKEVAEASAPFRLIVLGCMLANKWLDDHTFSNKTWHNISNIPIQALNKLESLALDIFTYDLTISSRDWSQWLAHIMSYHMSLASPTHPQPISRPSTNPHSIVRKAIDEVLQVSVTCSALSVPQPVFTGLEERRREKLEQEQAMAADILEIDLDEDGPLREEYLPKRRVSAAGTYRDTKPMQPFTVVDNIPTAPSRERRDFSDLQKPLPPPAKWSPAADEPIHRERNRASGQYVAVQPPVIHVAAAYPIPYRPSVDFASYYHWNTTTYAPVKPPSNYAFDFPGMNSASHQTAYNAYPYIPQIPISHSRSQSLSHDDENLQIRHHMRSFSQSRYEYQCSDLRMTANEFAPHMQGENGWMRVGHYQYHGSAFAPIHNVNYQQAWLRT
ncbi:hypothetical protein H0H87_011740 [Tephrocybe sp. NHM501043]|nr:hypothetical protein H0H87_011740 [Tephrocybe sp. NHM501043]